MATSIDTAREDPLVGFHFAVEVQGKVTGYFSEVSGLGSEQEVIEHKVVNEKGVEVVMKIPGRLKWENIVLKRGITSDMQIWDWRKLVEDGHVGDARSDGSVTMYDQALTAVARWEFKRAWPVKVTGPSVKSDSNEIGVEELTLAHEYISRVAV
ncbi:MAG: phage tail protein [Chloroflexi bacterium]|nr:phage tail protein [Chloroflexota bacterium]MBK6709772.1 phage tail protein [Chloroflexota bacterium]MBK7918620.1 phage tail protein [Chloroflexota bacterium]MBK8932720.1 phage tail protein [Chloroflexota bacterium]